MMIPRLFKYTNIIGKNNNGTLLVCFHNGGGGASIYKNWPEILQQECDVIAVQLPGREDRLDELFYTDISQIVSDINVCLKVYQYQSIILFGYCMGGLIAYELAQYMRTINLKALLIAASAEPIYAIQNGLNKQITDETLKQIVAEMFKKRYGIISDPEYLEMVLPILKADRKISIEYKHTHNTRLKLPIYVFGGMDDEGIPYEALTAWQQHTLADFAVHRFPGDHMFIEVSENQLLCKIKNILWSMNES